MSTGTVRHLEVREHPPINASKILDPMIDDLIASRTPDMSYQTPILPQGTLLDFQRERIGHLIVGVPARRGPVSFDRIRSEDDEEIADVSSATLTIDTPPVILDILTSGNGVASVHAFFVRQNSTRITLDTPLYDTWTANVYVDTRALCLGSTMSGAYGDKQRVYDAINTFVVDFYDVYYNDDLDVPREFVPAEIKKLCDHMDSASGVYEGWATWTQINENKKRIWEIDWPAHLPQTTLRDLLQTT